MSDVDKRLASLDDEAFRRVVDNELRNKATPAEADALRTPLNLGRWHATLVEIARDIRGQLDDPSRGDSWRYAAARTLARVKGRKLETQALLNDAATERRAERSRKLDAGTTVDKLREQAYESAVRQLIAAHRFEFLTLLRSTHDTAGVSLPGNIARQLARAEQTGD